MWKNGGGGHVTASAVDITEKQEIKMLTLNKRESLEYIVNAT